MDLKSEPKMRSIMEARVGPTTGLAEITCQILRKIKDHSENIYEIKSTEEIHRKFKDFNDNVLPGSFANKIIGSMDN